MFECLYWIFPKSITIDITKINVIGKNIWKVGKRKIKFCDFNFTHTHTHTHTHLYIYIYIWGGSVCVEKVKRKKDLSLMVYLFANTFWLQSFVWIQKYLIKIIFVREIIMIDKFLIQWKDFFRARSCCYVKKKKMDWYV